MNTEHLHTPLPWRLTGDEIRGSEDVHTNGRERNSIGVSSASYSDTVCVIHGSVELDAPRANAKFIVTACNAHYTLVKAVQDLLWHMPDGEEKQTSPWVEQARQAIATL